jgi:hypothetical protein
VASVVLIAAHRVANASSGYDYGQRGKNVE